MRRPFLLQRTAALLLAAWVTAFQAEPAALHVCAAHDGSGHATQAPGAQGSGAADIHAGHAMADVGSATDTPVPDRGHHAACTCPGGCTVAVALDVPEADASFVLDVAVPAHDPFSAIAAVATADTDHLRPFANGPPSLV